MKICPSCRKTYSDDNLNFCLDDGSILAFSNTEPPRTIMMGQPPPTHPNPLSRPTVLTGREPNFSMQPKKSSKTWMWIVGIIGILLLLCGGSSFALLFWIASQSDITDNSSVNNDNRNSWPTASPTPVERTNVQKIDLEGWVQTTSAYGNTEYTGGELIMSSKSAGYYYVLVAQKKYSTAEATTRISVRNLDDKDTSMGYGLVFHSDSQPLVQDYSFLIDARKQRFRIVRHIPQDEPVIVEWTDSNAIKNGKQVNVLEARDKDGSVELYINGKMITSIQNIYGAKNGVPGVYSGDGVRAAFSNLEIRK